ncbi:MAG: ABC transporter substrate-binding protein, partial [Fibrobacterota bacterium]
AAGYKKQADSLITVYNTKVHAVRDKNRSRDRIPMFFQIGRDPLYTVTKHSFIHDYMDFCGAQNIAADAPSGRISREAVIEGKPGIIIVTEMGGSRQHPLHAWKSYKSIPAVQEEAVYSVNTAKACSPNLPMFYDLLTELDSLVNSRR